jgi:hypothetical protein
MKPEETRKLIETTEHINTTYIGTRTSQLGIEENIGIPDDKRLLHTLTLGPTGYGKTQAMIHAALQDTYKDHGLCMVIPKGEAIDQFLQKVPEKRLDDIIYINPADQDTPRINVLEPHTHEDMNQAQRENQKEIIVSDLIDLFKRYSENWGDRFGRILETLLRAYLDLNMHGNTQYSLLDVFETVTQNQKLTELIDNTDDPVIREQLVRVKEDMGSYELEPLQRRLNDFVMNPTVRRVIATQESSLNFRDAVKKGKIILVDIQKGEIGETVSQLVGSITITKTWAAAQSRITQNPEDRDPFHLYVDELQNFAGEGSNFTKILSEAREYKLGCWLITQYLHQLSPNMRTAVTNNCRNKIIFNPVGSDNTTQIAGMLPGITKTQLKTLGKYRAALQTPNEQNQNDAVTLNTYPPYTTDRNTHDIKQQAKPNSHTTTHISTNTSLGNTANAGGEKHAQLLKNAKQELENQGFHVNLLYQDQGDNKPDGHATHEDEVHHLEAEHTTLTKPAKVLQNLRRAHRQDREVIFAVQPRKAQKLKNILEDPVNRRGNQHEDQKGTYSYYTDPDGQPVTDIDELQNTEYQILEVTEQGAQQHQPTQEPECPELEENNEQELQNFCLYRDNDGHCTELGERCVLLD